MSISSSILLVKHRLHGIMSSSATANEWAVVVGEHLTVWHHTASVTRIKDERLR